jgi:hypothetical protein
MNTSTPYTFVWVLLRVYSAVLNFCSAQINSEFRSRVVAFRLHVLEVSVSNLEPGSEYSDLNFHGFSQFIETNVGKMPPV